MAKIALVGSKGASIAASTTAYRSVGHGIAGSGASTEANAKTIFRSPGTLSNVYVRIATNDRAASTLVSRVNGANGNISISIGGSTTGEFSDTTHSDYINNGDLVAYSMTTGAGGTTFIDMVYSAQFDSIANTVVKYAYGAQAITFSSAGVTAYYVFGGGPNGTSATESMANVRMRHEGTFKNLFANVTTNTSTNPVTIGTRLGGANGNLLISAAGTGYLEDTTNSDNFVNGAACDLVLITGAGTVNMVLQSIGIECVNTEFSNQLLAGEVSSGGANYALGVTNYIPLGYPVGARTTESDVQISCNQNCMTSNLQCNIGANVSGGSTITLRKNGAPATQSISTGAGTGFFEDTTNKDEFLSTDKINYQIVVGGAGTIRVSFISLKTLLNQRRRIGIIARR